MAIELLEGALLQVRERPRGRDAKDDTLVMALVEALDDRAVRLKVLEGTDVHTSAASRPGLALLSFVLLARHVLVLVYRCLGHLEQVFDLTHHALQMADAVDAQRFEIFGREFDQLVTSHFVMQKQVFVLAVSHNFDPLGYVLVRPGCDVCSSNRHKGPIVSVVIKIRDKAKQGVFSQLLSQKKRKGKKSLLDRRQEGSQGKRG